MRYLSVCSGIEAATVAWHNLGWTPVGFSEIEPFPSAVLAHHYPNVPNFGDMTQHEQWPIEPGSIDLLVGGTPCQAFSVAGLRGGLSDPRGGLMLTYLEIARRLRPKWVVWENVPGVLSSGQGRDFGSFLGALGELRYGWAYRVIDAQYCRVDGRWPKAVPQRRRRVFVVGCDLERDPRGRERAAEVLALGTGLRWHLEESRKTRKAAPSDAQSGVGTGRITSHDVAPCLETTCHDYSRADGFTMVSDVSATIAARFGNSRNNHEECVAQPKWPAEVAPTLAQSRSGSGSPGYSDQELFLQGAGNLIPQPVPIQDGREIQKAQNGIGVGDQGDPAYTLDTTGAQAVGQPIPFTKSKRAQSVTDDETWVDGQVNPTLSLFDQGDTRATTVAVAFANRTRDGIKMPEIMADGIVPALTNPGDGGRSDAINVAVVCINMGGDKGKASNQTSGAAYTISTGDPHAVAVGFNWQNGGGYGNANDGLGIPSPPAVAFTPGNLARGAGPSPNAEVAPTQRCSAGRGADDQRTCVAQAMTVRRLLPVECERLQGFPDDYTLIPWRKKEAADCPDGPRYKALGNSMAVNCMAWIGERIAAVENHNAN